MMMKVLFIIFTLSIQVSFARVSTAKKLYRSSNKDYAKLTEELMKSKYFFSASLFAKEHIIKSDKLSATFEDRLVKLILRTGTQSFIPLSNNALEKHNSPALSLVLAIKYFQKKQYQKALSSIKKISLKHRFGPEARMIKGSAQNLLKKYSAAEKSYKQCIQLSRRFESKSKNKKVKRYYTIISETCISHLARLHYSQKDYKKAIRIWDKIPKTSYRWPYILLEKAWAHYYLEDYNRTLGILTTYKSPLLASYFLPEAEVLSSLAYYQLCLWQDSLVMYKQFYSVHKKNSDKLKKILLKEKTSHSYFLKLLFQPLKSVEDENVNIRKLVTQTRKQVKFSVDLVNYKSAKNEMLNLKRFKSSTFKKDLMKNLKLEISWRAKHLNHYIKKNMFSYLNDIHRFSYEMFNIKLQVLSDKRDLVYKNKKLISSRSRGSQENVKRQSDQHFYKFQGEFWADELGDYSFGLKSNCKTVKKKKKKTVRIRKKRQTNLRASL